MNKMDAIEFAQQHLDELKLRLSHVDAPKPEESVNTYDPINAGKTPQEVVKIFLDDQGISFTNVDIDAILKLV